MTDPRCESCAYMVRDARMRRRCYSPQIKKAGLAGILINFERDATPEPERSVEAGNGKCGPLELNYKRREAV